MLQAFVEFADAEGAQQARNAIHGRMFAGQQVQMTFLTAEEHGAAIAATGR